MGGVGTWALLIGVPTAWLVAHYDFTARNILQWALFLPLAIPTYIGAYAFVDFWEYAGPAQTLLRDTFGWQNPQDYSQWFIPVRSQLSAIFVLGFGLYPYVYMLARAAFVEQSANAVESARCLGIGAWGCFFPRFPAFGLACDCYCPCAGGYGNAGRIRRDGVLCRPNPNHWDFHRVVRGL